MNRPSGCEQKRRKNHLSNGNITKRWQQWEICASISHITMFYFEMRYVWVFVKLLTNKRLCMARCKKNWNIDSVSTSAIDVAAILKISFSSQTISLYHINSCNAPTLTAFNHFCCVLRLTGSGLAIFRFQELKIRINPCLDPKLDKDCTDKREVIVWKINGKNRNDSTFADGMMECYIFMLHSSSRFFSCALRTLFCAFECVAFIAWRSSCVLSFSMRCEWVSLACILR